MPFNLPTDYRVWLHGLIAAFIGGAASSVTAAIVAPQDFNFQTWTGFRSVLIMAGVSGFVSACGFLKQSPLPPAQTDITITKTVSVTGASQDQTDAVAAAAVKQPITGTK